MRDESLETNSQQQPLRHSLGSAEAAGDGPARRQAHGGLGEESGSQLAARLNSSAFGTEQVPPSALILLLFLLCWQLCLPLQLRG